MVLFTLISQAPLIPLRGPHDLVKRNKVTLMLGAALYLTLGALIYTKKLPEFITAKLPDFKILAGIVVADILLYAGIHKFQFGVFPVLSMPPGMAIEDEAGQAKKKIAGREEEWSEGDDEDTITNSLKQKGGSASRRRSRRNRERNIVQQRADQLRAMEPPEPAPVPIEDDEISDDQYLVEEENEPNELSMAEQDFFQKKDKTVVENWDVEDFSNMEMV